MKEVREVQRTLDIAPYLEHVPAWVVPELRCLAAPLRGATVVHVNSTASGGGVAEIPHRLVPLQRGLGLDAHWLVIDGDEPFFSTTKKFHNALQGGTETVADEEWSHWIEVNRANLDGGAERLREADFVVIHDPQPAALLASWEPPRPLGVALPHRPVASPAVLAAAATVRRTASTRACSPSRRSPAWLPHPQVMIPPAIDPLTDKNPRPRRGDGRGGVSRVSASSSRLPLFVQISRFDRFKDPLGVVAAFRLLRRHRAARLVLAGGGAADDPEGREVLAEVRHAVGEDPDILVLELPPDANVEVNALQRAATVVVQKSLNEGFGLVVTEGLWKAKPVIGGAVGGITLQVRDGLTGYLVRTVEGCAFRMRECLRHPRRAQEMGERGWSWSAATI